MSGLGWGGIGGYIFLESFVWSSCFRRNLGFVGGEVRVYEGRGIDGVIVDGVRYHGHAGIVSGVMVLVVRRAMVGGALGGWSGG